MARTIALSINGDKFSENVNNHAEANAATAGVNDLLDRIRQHSDIRFAYAIHHGEGGAVHLLSPNLDSFLAATGSTGHSNGLAHALVPGDGLFSSVLDPAARQDGKAEGVITAFAPIRDSDDNVVGAVGVGVTADDFLHDANSIRNALILLLLPITLLLGAGVLRFIKVRKTGSNGVHSALQFLDDADSLVFAADPESGHLLYLNRNMSTFFDIDPQSAPGELDANVLGDKLSPYFLCPVPNPKHGAGGILSHQWEHFEPRHDMWIGAHSIIIPGQILSVNEGRAVQLFIGTDITGQKRLEDRVKAQERELRTSEDRGRKAARAKESLIANVNHEARTSMNGIIGFAELASMEPNLSEKTSGYLRKIKLGAEDMLHTMNDILDISRIESGELRVKNKRFSLHDVLDACRDASEDTARRKGLNLYFYAEPHVDRQLLGDPDKLKRILLELLSNAIKYTNRGIVKLSASAERSNADSSTIYFEIKDSGVGMTPEQVKGIFEPFSAARKDDKRRASGSGLGLALANRLVQSMGGQLTVESARGLGSKFSFRLTFTTLDKPKPAAPESERSEYLPPLKGHVLICEDNFINQEVLRENLLKFGLTVDVAPDGRIGVEMAEKARHDGQAYDLILMDVHMPVMDGLEATEQLRTKENPSPIIGLTANVMHRNSETYFKIGMVDCLNKPFLSHELWTMLRRYLPEKHPDGSEN